MRGIAGTRLSGLIISLLLVGGIVGWTFVKKAEYERGSREQLVADIATLKDYEANRALIDPIVEQAHEVAFEAAYRWRLPGRSSHRRPAFRPDTYDQHAYVEIIGALKADGREDLALAVERLRARK